LPSVASATDFGSGTITEIRACTTVPCFNGPRSTIVGVNKTSADAPLSASIANGASSASTNVAFGGAFSAPVIKSFGLAESQRQVFSSTWAFQEYTWTGLTSISFGLTGAIDFTTTGRNATLAPDDRTGLLQTTLALYDPNLYASVSRNDILGGLNSSYQSSANSGIMKSGVINLSTTDLNTGSYITLAPGQRIGVAMLMELSAISDAFVDSSHSFNVSLDNRLSLGDREQLMQFLRADGQSSPVPEVPLWMMMIAGFGVVGVTLRRKHISGYSPVGIE
jgi:hypothetical protein